MLFQVDLTGEPVDSVFAEFWKGQKAETEVRDFAESLVRGVLGHRDADVLAAVEPDRDVLGGPAVAQLERHRPTRPDVEVGTRKAANGECVGRLDARAERAG